MNHQEHFGRKFYQDKKVGYWISTDYPRIRAHQWVWINSHGAIPKGYHIHHKDENKSNNFLVNLELIERGRHHSHHMSDPERKRKSAEMADKYRHLTKEWHGSAEGKAWHKFHAIKCKFGKWDKISYLCEECGNEYETSKRSRIRFCSNACRSMSRRKSGVDNIVKNCKLCHKEFISNKYSKNIFCSRKCSATGRFT